VLSRRVFFISISIAISGKPEGSVVDLCLIPGSGIVDLETREILDFRYFSPRTRNVSGTAKR
jgi:hypothetical protein